jgi:hypothetical protein
MSPTTALVTSASSMSQYDGTQTSEIPPLIYIARTQVYRDGHAKLSSYKVSADGDESSQSVMDCEAEIESDLSLMKSELQNLWSKRKRATEWELTETWAGVTKAICDRANHNWPGTVLIHRSGILEYSKADEEDPGGKSKTSRRRAQEDYDWLCRNLDDGMAKTINRARRQGRSVEEILTADRSKVIDYSLAKLQDSEVTVIPAGCLQIRDHIFDPSLTAMIVQLSQSSTYDNPPLHHLLEGVCDLIPKENNTDRRE